MGTQARLIKGIKHPCNLKITRIETLVGKRSCAQRLVGREALIASLLALFFAVSAKGLKLRLPVPLHLLEQGGLPQRSKELCVVVVQRG